MIRDVNKRLHIYIPRKLCNMYDNGALSQLHTFSVKQLILKAALGRPYTSNRYGRKRIPES